MSNKFPGTFKPVPDWVHDRCIKSKNSKAILVYIGMAAHRNNDSGLSFTKNKNLATELGCHARSISRGKAILRSLGCIVFQGNKGRADCYLMPWEEPPASTDMVRQHPKSVNQSSKKRDKSVTSQTDSIGVSDVTTLSSPLELDGVELDEEELRNPISHKVSLNPDASPDGFCRLDEESFCGAEAPKAALPPEKNEQSEPLADSEIRLQPSPFLVNPYSPENVRGAGDTSGDLPPTPSSAQGTLFTRIKESRRPANPIPAIESGLAGPEDVQGARPDRSDLQARLLKHIEEDPSFAESFIDLMSRVDCPTKYDCCMPGLATSWWQAHNALMMKIGYKALKGYSGAERVKWLFLWR